MEYCTTYNKKIIKSILNFDEIIIKYNNNENEIIDFIQDHTDKKIIIDFLDYPDTLLLAVLKELIDKKNLDMENIMKEKIKIRISNTQIDETKHNILQKSGFLFFYNSYINNWESFLEMCTLEVSDVYIVEELGFDLERVSKIAKKNNIKIRVIPNIAQSFWEDLPQIKKFFIRPEDVDIYDNYIDVFEFIGEVETIPTLLKIYKKDKKWIGELQDIVYDLSSTEKINNEFILPQFGERRPVCQRKCLKGESCRICDDILILAKKLEEVQKLVNKNNKED